MSYDKIMRWSGLAGLLAGVIIILFNIGTWIGVVNPNLDNFRNLITILLTLFTLMGVYSHQYRRAGTLGLLGFVLFTISLVLNFSYRFINVTVSPYLQNFPDALAAIGQGPYLGVFSLTSLFFVLGFVLFGVGTIRAGVFPRQAAWLIIASAILSFLATILMNSFLIYLSGIVYGATFLWLGYAMWAEAEDFLEAVHARPAA